MKALSLTKPLVFLSSLIVSATLIFALSLFLKKNAEAQSFKSNGMLDKKLRHEVALIWTWKHFDQLLQPTEDLNLIQEDIDPIAVNHKGMPLSFPKGQLSALVRYAPVVSEGNRLQIKTEQLALRLNFRPFTVEQDVIEYVGNTQVRVRLRAECDGISLVQTGARTNADIEWVTRAQELQARFINFDLHWPRNSWQVSSVRCRGPRGLDKLVQEELKKELSDPEIFRKVLKDSLEDLLNREIKSAIEKIKSPRWLFEPGRYDETEFFRGLVFKYTDVKNVYSRGLILSGVLSVQKNLAGLSDEDFYMLPLLLNDEVIDEVSDRPTIIMSRFAIQEMLNQMSHGFIYHSNLSNFDGFQSLMNSRFQQGVVWPDLRNYKKNANFPMTSRLKPGTTLFVEEDTLVNLEGGVQTWIKSHRGGRDWNYVFLDSKLSSNMKITVDKDRLVLDLLSHKLNSKSSMYSDYVNQFEASTRVSTNPIDRAIRNSILSDSLFIGLPRMEISEGMHYRANEIKRANTYHFFLEFEPEP